MSNSNFDQSANNQQGELELTAFRYLSNELSDKEQQQFETLMESSQDARECLVQTMELIQASYNCEELEAAVLTPSYDSKVELRSSSNSTVDELSSSNASFNSRFGWLLAGAAAALFVSFIINSSFNQPVSDIVNQSPPLISTPETNELAQLWVANTSDEELAEIDELSQIENELALTQVDAEQLNEEDSSESIPPDWMLVALTVSTEAHSDMGTGVTSEMTP